MGAPCSQRCYNTYGTFLCRCDLGYELGPDGFACNGKRPPVIFATCLCAPFLSSVVGRGLIKPELATWQTLTSAATPATSASTSVSMNQESSPACALKGTSCWEPDCARVSTHLPPLFPPKTNTFISVQVTHSLRAALILHTLVLSCSRWSWDIFPSADINECETGEHQCTETQTCVNIHGRYQCVDSNRCQDPYIQVSEKWVTPRESSSVLTHKHTLSHTFSQLLKYVLALASEYNQGLYWAWLKIFPITFSTHESNVATFFLWTRCSAIRKLLQSWTSVGLVTGVGHD